jgi:hypothetical protein
VIEPRHLIHSLLAQWRGAKRLQAITDHLKIEFLFYVLISFHRTVSLRDRCAEGPMNIKIENKDVPRGHTLIYLE